MANEKWIDYSVKIGSQIQQMFEEDCENHIPPSELNDGENFKHFIHALATVIPCRLFNKMTSQENDLLNFNHIANHIVFDFTQRE